MGCVTSVIILLAVLLLGAVIGGAVTNSLAVAKAIDGNERSLEEIHRANSSSSRSFQPGDPRQQDGEFSTGPRPLTLTSGGGTPSGAEGERDIPSPPATTPPAQEWIFSVYATRYTGRRTASGERYDPAKLTAASNAHRIGTLLLCRHKGRSVRVRVNDRLDRELGKTRIDLSGAAFKALRPSYDMTDRTAGLARGTTIKERP